jgi:hypothetical protein
MAAMMPMAPIVPVDHRPFTHVVALIVAKHAFDVADYAADRSADCPP